MTWAISSQLDAWVASYWCCHNKQFICRLYVCSQCAGCRCACYSGSAFISQRPFDRCSVRHLGSQAISTADGHFYLCTNSTHEVQSMVSLLCVFAWVNSLVHYLLTYLHVYTMIVCISLCCLSEVVYVFLYMVFCVCLCVWSRWYFALLSLSGIFSVTFSVVFAYVADVTTEEDRSAAYGLVCCCLWLGMLVVCKHWCSQFKAADIPTVQRRLLSKWFYTTAILQLRC